MKRRFVAYFRVSTVRQGASGLGLEAQRKCVSDFLAADSSALIEEFTEIESGKNCERVQLQHALRACRIHDATLLVAKLDRLARNAYFLLGIQEAGVDFIACDMPSANRLTIGLLAVIAEEETRMISARTKAALQAAKARGTKLGNPANLTRAGMRRGAARSAAARRLRAHERAQDLAPIIAEIQSEGALSLRSIAKALNDRRYQAPRRGEWSAVQVQRVISQLNQ